jgi:addiction module HigA family antidote
MARTPIHPGEILADELAELGITATELARVLRVPPNRITQILAGKRAVTADTALRLGKWLGTNPELWLNLQKLYELDLARPAIRKELAAIKPNRAPNNKSSAKIPPATPRP